MRSRLTISFVNRSAFLICRTAESATSSFRMGGVSLIQTGRRTAMLYLRLLGQQCISSRALIWTGPPACSSIKGRITGSVLLARHPTVTTWHSASRPSRIMFGCWKTSDLRTERTARAQTGDQVPHTPGRDEASRPHPEANPGGFVRGSNEEGGMVSRRCSPLRALDSRCRD